MKLSVGRLEAEKLDDSEWTVWYIGMGGARSKYGSFALDSAGGWQFFFEDSKRSGGFSIHVFESLIILWQRLIGVETSLKEMKGVYP